MTTICISGGRNYTLSEKGIDVLIKTFIKNFFQEELLLIEGGAKGIDSCIDKQLDYFFHLAEEEEWYFFRETYLAEWNKFGKKAGFERNKRMAEKCEFGILFPGGKGTDNMYQCLKSLNKKIIDFRENLDLVEVIN